MKINLIIFIVIITVILIVFSLLYKNPDSTREGFLSGFRQMYRPYIRKARLYTTSKYNSLSGKTSVFLRKNGFW